eukprot:TRINITY_DN487_c0_g2_i1.p2 TRINITY_DN487_c0_g2~~TRINITY_DN487_c0_g2_i1.p2  ORF type:complete len:410 (-),score=7.34 TRINITY_DN487_c0_g2_i1:824-1912(-)
MQGCPFRNLYSQLQTNESSKSSKLQTATGFLFEYALSKCPFLHNVQVKQGYERAVEFLRGPWKQQNSSSGTFSTVFETFHGTQGIVPLEIEKFGKSSPQTASSARVYEAIPQDSNDIKTKAACLRLKISVQKKRFLPSKLPAYSYGANAGFASLSLTGGWGNGFFKIGSIKKIRKRVRGKGKRNGKSNQKYRSQSNTLKASQNSGSCPMRKILGPFAGVVFNGVGKLSCPAPIVAMRASLAKTEFVRHLRPKSLVVKLATVGGIGVLANIPCGMIREHYKKFTVGWFVAVHATIPFVAMLRKAAILPQYALGVTVIAAVIGQSIGAKLEKQRLKCVCSQCHEVKSNGFIISNNETSIIPVLV